MSNITQESADRFLRALGEQLAARRERFELVVIGGSALLALGLVERTTKDVDIVALRSDEDLNYAKPLPEGLQAATTRSTSSSTPRSIKAPGSTSRIYVLSLRRRKS